MDREKLDFEHTYDVAIIGGGIVGSGLFREQALNNRSSVIIDQSDFNSQTSAGSSKMLHGGIRYLENFDFFLVFEALFEKNLWLKLAPHITKEIPFYLPVYKTSKWPLFLMKIGLFLYDLLSLFKNTPHKTLNKIKTLRTLPGLNEDGLRGCGMYFDAIVDDCKLGLECIYDGLLNKKCHALNYQEVIKLEKINDIYSLTLKDTLRNTTSLIKAKNVIIATGPFTDQTMKKLDIPWSPVIQASKGSHLWLKKNSLSLKNAMVLQTNDGRIIFVIPQRNSILVGTTEVPLSKDDNFKDIKPTQEEITYLLSEINNYFPEADVTEDDILASFAAVRPLVIDGHKSSKISRKHKTFNPDENLYVITGGKYTTFRKMAQELNSKLFKHMNWEYDKNLTLQPLKRTSVIEDPNDIKITKTHLSQITKDELVRTKEDLLERRLSLPSTSFLKDKEAQKEINKFEV